jgi:hypothetical protein
LELSKEMLQELKKKRIFLSDSDSNIICLLIDKVDELEKEVEMLELRQENVFFDDEDYTPKPKRIFKL